MNSSRTPAQSSVSLKQLILAASGSPHRLCRCSNFFWLMRSKIDRGLLQHTTDLWHFTELQMIDYSPIALDEHLAA